MKVGQLTSRKTELIFMVIICLVLGMLFYQVNAVLQSQFTDVEQRLAQGTMINLNDSVVGDKMKTLLRKEKYFRDEVDINFIGNEIEKAKKIHGSAMDNIGELNKSAYAVNAIETYKSGGSVLKKRVQSSQQLLGFANEDSTVFDTEISRPLSTRPFVNVGTGNGTIEGIITTREGNAVPSVLVRIKLVVPSDSNYNASDGDNDIPVIEFKNGIRKTFFADSAGKPVLQSITAYARTDVSGHFSFTGLAENRGYSVLPLQPGFQFGPSKGTALLSKNLSLKFYQAVHNVKLFSTKDFASLKKDKAFIVRTPAEVNKWLLIIAVAFLASFIFLHILLSWRFPQADQFLLPVIMMLTGISLLTLLSIQDPLRDRFLGRNTFYYFLAGFAGIVIMLFINLKKFTP
ncbi:MAG: cell cycle protein, partial [Ferruginibacter sp.]